MSSSTPLQRPTGADAIVKIEGLGKRYRLHHRQAERYVALRDVLANAITTPLRWLRSGRRDDTPRTEDFWALEDVSFDVAPGEVIGIIGRNGAGKSTLLKILSRITEPTRGRVTLNGRVASLLEVGTGFHPELSGRENILLNGAILGMTRAEILRKFDDIVAFAEVERFLDTPVKRYSSGMYVRLAFAVAAHLEPEILIVDEVLAVGDAAFQKKSLGKMQEASKGGRTVLFVSHNMAAVTSLTTRCVVLSAGRVAFDGASSAAVEHYMQLGASFSETRSLGRGTHTTIRSARLLGDSDQTLRHYVPGTPFRIEIVFETDGASNLSMDAFLVDAASSKLAMASSHHFHGVALPQQAGTYRTVLELQPLWLASGTYYFDLTTALVNVEWDHYVENLIEFDVVSSNPGGLPWDYRFNLGYGAVALPFTHPPSFARHTEPSTAGH